MKKLAEILSIQDMDKLLDSMYVMVALTDVDGTLVAWNSAFETRKKSHPTANNLTDLLSPKDKPVLRKNLTKNAQQRWLVEFLLSDLGSVDLCNCLLIPTEDGRMLFIAERSGADSDLHETIERLGKRARMYQIESEYTKKIARNKQVELEAVVAQAREVSQTDALTFLFNRRAIVRELQDEVMRAERYNTPLSISIVDVDDFKAINDTHGHTVGDEVLKQVAHRLREGIRHPDLVGRYGGEEFLILLPSSDITAASEQADRLCRQVRETRYTVREHVIRVTLSIGVAQLKIGTDTWDSVLNRADSAMYEAKNKGRNCWVAKD
jgi:diguanylate cyclase (GGDEF)-like protein